MHVYVRHLRTRASTRANCRYILARLRQTAPVALVQDHDNPVSDTLRSRLPFTYSSIYFPSPHPSSLTAGPCRTVLHFTTLAVSRNPASQSHCFHFLRVCVRLTALRTTGFFPRTCPAKEEEDREREGCGGRGRMLRWRRRTRASPRCISDVAIHPPVRSPLLIDPYEHSFFTAKNASLTDAR